MQADLARQIIRKELDSALKKYAGKVVTKKTVHKITKTVVGVLTKHFHDQGFIKELTISLMAQMFDLKELRNGEHATNNESGDGSSGSGQAGEGGVSGPVREGKG